MSGTDMTIGADTALHRITEAIDAIATTAASHQRTFVVEVMGRHCGYLALMGALATGAGWVLIPESPPGRGRLGSRRCAPGSRPAARPAGATASSSWPRAPRTATASPSPPSTSARCSHERLGEDVRVTILGHVQRGGSPSAFDRYMSTMLGHAAVDEVLASPPRAARPSSSA